jgi:hypothetical protein
MAAETASNGCKTLISPMVEAGYRMLVEALKTLNLRVEPDW